MSTASISREPRLYTYKPSDYLEAVERSRQVVPSGLPLDAMARQLEGGAAFTARVRGRVLFCFGICRMWEGVGEAWSMLTTEAVEYPLFLHRSVKRTIWGLISAVPLHRVQATVLMSDVKAKRWAERLGFRAEGMLEAYGPEREDYLRYAIVRRG